MTGNYSFVTDLISSADGQGTIKQVNGITTFDTDRSLFTGKTEVTGGTLVVNSVLGGTVSVSSQGTLTGTGTVGSTTVLSGGSISPGAIFSTSPGQLVIDGDLTMQSGSKYIVDMNTDIGTDGTYQSDFLEVKGDAYLNGGGVVATTGGNLALYIPDSRWHILSATGSVIGQFDNLIATPFVNISYEYDPQDVFLVVTRNGVNFCQPGMSENQCSIGGNIDNNTGGNGKTDISNIIISQPSIEQASDAFNQLAGEIHASAKTVLLEDSRFLREAVNNRLRESPTENGAWAHAYGSWGDFRGNNSVADLKRNIGGIFLGADKQLDDTWTTGVITGYSKANLKDSQYRSTADRDDYHIGAYTKGQWDKLSLHAGVGQSWHQFSSDRSVAITGLQDHLTTKYHARTTQLFVESRYQLPLTTTLTMEPFVDGAYVQTYTQGFSEHGGIAKLSGSADHTDMFFSTIGNRLTQQFELENDRTVKLWGMAGWRHAYNDVVPRTQLNFVNYSAFEIKGTPISKDLAILEAGLEINLTKDTNVGLTYNGHIGDNSTDHGTKAYFNWHF